MKAIACALVGMTVLFFMHGRHETLPNEVPPIDYKESPSVDYKKGFIGCREGQMRVENIMIYGIESKSGRPLIDFDDWQCTDGRKDK